LRPDTLEQLRVDIENLETCAELLKLGSHVKARTALIVLDHISEIFLLRECQGILEKDSLFKWVLPPKLRARDRARITRNFHEKLELLQKEDFLSPSEVTVLTISHSYRNAIYHRDTHNPSTIDILAKIGFLTVLDLFERSGDNCAIGNSAGLAVDWLKPYYGSRLSNTHIDITEARKTVADKLRTGINVSRAEATAALAEDIESRTNRLVSRIAEFTGDSLDWLDKTIRRLEFEEKHEELMDELSEPHRQVRYRIQGQNKPTIEEYEQTEASYKSSLNAALDAFSPTYTVESIRAFRSLSKQLESSHSLSELLSLYNTQDQAVNKAELYIHKVEAIIDEAVQMEIDRARGK